MAGEYYGTYEEAEEHFANQLNVDAWKYATVQDRINSLVMAAQAIDRLNFAGDKAVPDQVLQFPRLTDTEIPQDIKTASYLIAYRYLDGYDMDKELENTRVNENKIGPITSIYANISHEWVRAGIPSGLAWGFLRPYLRDPKEISMERVS